MDSIRVCILDYGSGNVRSVYNLFVAISKNVEISNEPEAIRNATHLVLPGVGAFGASMARVRERIPISVLEECVRRGSRPFLGICVGLQLMAAKGHEFGEHEGFGWIGGSVMRLDAPGCPLPHVGWNSVEGGESSPLMKGLRSDEDFYFVHSYALVPDDASVVAATTTYGQEFPSIIAQGNLFGVQFHPEKSQRAGRRLVENFLAIR